MERKEVMIELADHVKHKIRQNQFQRQRISRQSSKISDIDDMISPKHSYSRSSVPIDFDRKPSDRMHETYRLDRPRESLTGEKKPNTPKYVSSIRMATDDNSEHCEQCQELEYLLQVKQQHVETVQHENQKLIHQLRTLIQQNCEYEEEIEQLRSRLKKMNSHLYQHHRDFDELKQKIAVEKKTNPKLIEEDDEDQQDKTSQHLKRLQYEVQMYNRLVAAKENEEKRRVFRGSKELPF